MKPFVKKAFIALLSITLTGIGTACYGSPPGIPSPFNISLEPVGPMEKGSPITVSLTYGPVPKYSVCGDSGSVSVMTLTYPARDTLSKASWPVIFDENHLYSTTFDISVPDNAITKLRILLGCGWIKANPTERTLITTGDTVQFLVGYMPPTPPTVSEYNDPIRDTLTQEHLQTEYEIIIDLRDSSHLEFATKILRSIPDTCLYDKRRGYYRIKTTLENLIKFGDHNFEFEFTTPPPWDRKYKAPSESAPEK
jgi:hypothetical protein